MSETKTKEKKGFILRALDTVERVGNGLPNPATIFIILTAAVIVISAICAACGVSVTYDFLDSKAGEINQMSVAVVSLLAPDSIRHMVTTVVSNFTGFFALGTVFTIMIGVGVADGTGFLSALLRKVAASTPKGLVTSVVVFLGIMSNIASSTGYVVLVPLGAILFMAFGRHPIAGLAAAFAGVSGGWSANLLIATNDPMFAGMSTQAAQTLDPNYTVLPVANWFFMIASTFLITAIGTLVTDKLVEPRLTPYVPDASEQVQDIAENEKRGMRFAGITALVYVLFIASFMVLIFFAAQFTACFNYSNLGTIISVSGADFLKSVGFTGLPLIIGFIVLTAFINIFIAVDSAKWAIMAPIFVPMFMRLGLSPELTQCAYRIGDSATNIIAPLMPFFVLTVAFFQKYDKKAGIGSVISTMLPYSICFLLGWLVMFSVWYLLGLPLGPGSPMFY